MKTEIELTLLSEQEVYGPQQIDVIAKYGTQALVTDLAILTGGHCNYSYEKLNSDYQKIIGWYYTKSSDANNYIQVIGEKNYKYIIAPYLRLGIIRPVIKSSKMFREIIKNRRKYNEIEEVEYGEYPQYAPSETIQEELEREFKRGTLRSTGKNYTFDRTECNDYSEPFQSIKYIEYEYKGKKYIRIKSKLDYDDKRIPLSNNKIYHTGDIVWIEVSPVVWLIDKKTKTLISKVGLLSGIRFNSKNTDYMENFNQTEMYLYLNEYMLKDLIQHAKKPENMTPEEKRKYNEEAIQKLNIAKRYVIQIGLLQQQEGTVNSNHQKSMIKKLEPNINGMH